jgi:hypothetical protein
MKKKMGIVALLVIVAFVLIGCNNAFGVLSQSILVEGGEVENIELQDDKYEVVDVMVNRHEMIISIQDLQSEEKTITDHRIDLRNHDFLKTILPHDEITIVRQNADDKLYFWWVDKNLRLCLDEFE